MKAGHAYANLPERDFLEQPTWTECAIVFPASIDYAVPLRHKESPRILSEYIAKQLFSKGNPLVWVVHRTILRFHGTA